MKRIVEIVNQIISRNSDNENFEFRKLDRRMSEKEIVFIDGGNNELINSPEISVQILRTASVVFKKNSKQKIIKKEYYCICNNNESTLIPINNKENNITIKFKETFNPSTQAEITRRILELKSAENIIEKFTKGITIVLDGSLETNSITEKEYMDKLIKNAKNKNILLSSLVKTDRTLINNKNIITTLQNHPKAPNEPWMLKYKTKNDSHISKTYVKLNQKSQHIFRFETIKKQTINLDINKILGLLVSNSEDPVFLGYPYGLILADQFARVSNEEQNYFKQRLIQILNKDSEIKALESALNAHEKLDTIS